MFDFITKYFKERTISEFEETLAVINACEKEIKALSDEGMLALSKELKAKLASDEDSSDVLPRAFALAREAAYRTLKQRPYDAQIIGGLVLHKGAVAEMATGEGKTLSAVQPAYFHALYGQGVHVVTVNEYLARRDAVWMGQVYRSLGLSVACLVPNGAFLYDPEWHIAKDAEALIDKERDTTGSFLVQQEFLRPVTRREAYLADITYGTNHEFGFDYLRDNLVYSFEQQVQRGHYYAIIDEVDSILIDEARTPLIISAPDSQSSEHYKTFARVALNLKQEEDFAVDEKLRTVTINETGIEKVEKIVGVQNIYATENLRLVHYLEESLRAKVLFRKDKDYVVKNGEIIIVDEFTGRLLQGRRYNGGLHQAIEAKEGVLVKEESRTYAKVSIQNYFRMYKKISGMTGTAQTSAEEFSKVYGLEVVSVPPHRPIIRDDATDVIYKNTLAKWKAIAKDIKERHDRGQPVLVGTTSIEKSEIVSTLLAQAGIKHEVLNAKNNEREGSIIAQAGQLGAVTVATNMAGRGVDIILGGNPPILEDAAKVKELGGLHVVGTERHEARRIDNQLRGRAGRQGDQGSSQFYLSLEDDLLRIFGGDRVKGMMDKFDLPEDEPIQIGFVGRAVQQAQSKVEGANFDVRKHLLEYDDVLNKQRTAVYRRRQEILTSLVRTDLGNIIFEAAAGHLDRILEARNVAEDLPEAERMPEGELKKMFVDVGVVAESVSWPEDSDRDALRGMLTKRSVEATMDGQTVGKLLGILDMLWMSHLDNLEALSESVGLRAYGQKDPLVEYRQEAHRLFKDFWVNFDGWVFNNLFKNINPGAQAPVAKPVITGTPQLSGGASGDSQFGGEKVGRNDPCMCGSGKKYKKCHGA